MENSTIILEKHLLDGDITEKEIMSFLNNQDNFKTFGEALDSFIKNLFDTDNSYQYLLKAYNDKKIPYNRNTLKNWFFTKKRPKSGMSNRNNIYKIAFALNLNIDQTEKLFIEVYHDRPFDLRQMNEFIYFCCLNLNYEYMTAQSLIEEMDMNFIQNHFNYTVHTQTIYNDAKHINNILEIKEYINKHLANFDYEMLSAKRVVASLKESVCLNEQDITYLKQGKLDLVSSAIAKERGTNIFEDETLQGKSLTSVNTMLDQILFFNFSQKRKENERFVKNAKVLDEIKSCFPNEATLAKENPTYEELRKIIILLSSYHFWVEVQERMDNGHDFDNIQLIEDYQSEINDALNDANLPLLYVGNPYDWLFLYCTMPEEDLSPLDKFRNILFQAFQID